MTSAEHVAKDETVVPADFRSTDMRDVGAILRAALAGAQRPSSDFDLNPETVLPPERKLRPAGVPVPVLEGGDGAPRRCAIIPVRSPFPAASRTIATPT